MKRIRLAVRDLVAWNFCSGDLVRLSQLDHEPFSLSGRYAEGQHGHRLVREHRQNQDPLWGAYSAELPVQGIRKVHNLELEIGGRIDGLLIREDKIILEEVKTTYEAPGSLTEASHPAYWVQAICYAALYMASKALPELTVQLTYLILPANQMLSFSRIYTIAEAESILMQLLENLAEWIRERQARTALRDSFLSTLSFPFPELRPGQQELMQTVQNAVTGEKSVYIQAPTGIGKTMAVIYPALKALGAGQLTKIFFLTAKTTGCLAVLEALHQLAGPSTSLVALPITAREKICPYGSCDASACRYALGYYNRLHEAIRETIKIGILTQQNIAGQAEHFELCPFEFSLDLALEADLVIGDYNYLFDPRTHLRRFFDQGRQDYLFLIDEAHNLPERAREMYSATVSKELCLKAQEALAAIGEKGTLYKSVRTLLNLFQKEIKECRSEGLKECRYVRQALPENFLPALADYRERAEAFFNQTEHFRPLARGDFAALLELFYMVAHFLAMADEYAENYVTCFEQPNRQDATLKLFCADPAPQIQECLTRGRAAVFFSGSLLPLPYYLRLLGAVKKADSLVLASPFAEEKRLILVTSNVSTLYKQRQNFFSLLTKYIAALTGSRIGNYFIFFPAYAYLQQAFPYYYTLGRPGGREDLIIQQPAFSEVEKVDLLERLKAEPGKTVFAITGGILGESVDLPGESLTGVMIAGVALPQVVFEQEVLRSYFDQYDGEGKGFLYAYVYPGFKRVVQAAGRVIRSDTDKGIILLADQRFLEQPYLSLLEEHFPDYQIVDSPNEAGEKMRRFWSAAAD